LKLTIGLSLLVSIFTVSAQAQNYSETHCKAYTQCLTRDMWGRTIPNGVISCEVFGAAYTNYAGGNTSQCNWRVQPYAAVSCQGFVKSYDFYGNAVWGWQNFNFKCPGM
jgi:hypothetical protein